MNDFKELVLNTKKVSIWGIGYLGYTTILKLQEHGFCATIYDFTESRLSELKNHEYPNKEQFNSWSKSGEVPEVNLDKVDIASDKNSLFENKIHIISFPNTENNDYKSLANIFIKNKNKLDKSLIVFQSAGVPRNIEKSFSDELKKHKINIEIATIFRSDWTIEDFFNKSYKRVISGNNEEAIFKTELILKLLNLESIRLTNIEEAEVYENTKNALNYTMVAFFNQLSLAYPHININDLSDKILKDLNFKNISLGVSGVDYKSEQSCENILRGSSGDFLSILKEANTTNISFLFYYVNLLKSKNVDSVTILGLSSYNSKKDFRFSPSVILSEYLNKVNIKVYIHDENLNQEELIDILPNCEFVDISCNPITSDVAVIMSLCNEYKFFTQANIYESGLFGVKYIFDNTGFFGNFKYSVNTQYHQLCDGQLEKVLK